MWGWGKGGADSEEGGSSRGRRALTRVAHTRLPVLGGGGGHLEGGRPGLRAPCKWDPVCALATPPHPLADGKSPGNTGAENSEKKQRT